MPSDTRWLLSVLPAEGPWAPTRPEPACLPWPCGPSKRLTYLGQAGGQGESEMGRVGVPLAGGPRLLESLSPSSLS